MNYLQLPSFSEQGFLQAVIEIPAGTNRKFEFNKAHLRFEPDMREGRQRMVRFLPYPVNYGFIPSTHMEKNRGGDGDPLDILLLAEHLPTGSVEAVIPIGLMRLKDTDELDHKVLAIPAEPDKRIINAGNWAEFVRDYSPIKTILELFFMHYDGLGTMEVLPWGTEQDALEEVHKWRTASL